MTNFSLIYESTNITLDIRDDLLSIELIDFIENQADELTVTIADPTGKWLLDWYPSQGDTLSFSLNSISFGKFSIDEVSYQVKPNIVTIKAISAPLLLKLKTKSTKYYKDTDLKSIVKDIAKKVKLELKSAVEPIPIQTETRANETATGFLKRLGITYGYNFSIKDMAIIFSKLDEKKQSYTIDLSKTTNLSFKDSLALTKGKTKVVATDLNKVQITNKESVSTGDGNTEIINANQISESQAAAIAKAKSLREQRNKIICEFTTLGDANLRAGERIEIKGFGVFDGIYELSSTQHSFNNQGYITSIQANKI